MTSTINRPTTDTTTDPVCQTFTVGTLTIQAADEAEALRKYKRMVRAEGLKAKEEMSWCVDGTNERLRILGVREIGKGVPMKVTITATRTAYLNIDADDEAEAREVVAEGGEAVLTAATVLIGRGWDVTSMAPCDGPIVPIRTREHGERDDTVAGLDNETYSGIPRCEQYGNGWYCTMPHGHEGQHAAGDGRRIQYVWGGTRED